MVVVALKVPEVKLTTTLLNPGSPAFCTPLPFKSFQTKLPMEPVPFKPKSRVLLDACKSKKLDLISVPNKVIPLLSSSTLLPGLALVAVIAPFK